MLPAITLHRQVGGQVFIPADAIVLIAPLAEGCQLRLMAGVTLDVQEDAKTVAQSISSAIQWTQTRALETQLNLVKAQSQGIAVAQAVPRFNGS